MKFLLVEDDLVLAAIVEKLLSQHHYVTDLATDGISGRDMAEAFSYDLILVGWVVPRLGGMQLCKYLRKAGNDTPIILMTARDCSTDKVAGLDAGADDYLVKPFEPEELLARIRALLRRSEGLVSPILQWGDLRLDPQNSKVTCCHSLVAVTPKEYALLELFLRNPNRIFSPDTLLDRVWSFEDSPNVGSVRTHIKGLRRKLKKAGLPDMILTVYGLGYRLQSIPTAATAAATVNQTLKKEDTLLPPLPPLSTVPALALSTPSPTSVDLPLEEKFQLLLIQPKAICTPDWLSALFNAAPCHQMQIRTVKCVAHARAIIFSAERTGVRSPHIIVFDFNGFTEPPRNDSAELKLLAELTTVQPPIPSVVLTAAVSFEHRVSIARMGAARLLLMPVSPLELLKTVRRVLKKGVLPAAKVLIVDDDLALQGLLQSLLEPLGIQLQLLSDPQLFWQMIMQFKPDLVLLDVELPQLSGFDLCQVLRSDCYCHDMPVLLMSAHTDASTVQQMFSAGANDYIRKPIVAPELIARVLGWLERSRRLGTCTI